MFTLLFLADFAKVRGRFNVMLCDGQGSLGRGGFHKRNPMAMERIVGSNRTAMERTFGRLHFHVHSKRRGPGKDWFLEMVSACDETTRFWINAKILKDRERWSAGWLQRGELHGIKDETLRGGSESYDLQGVQRMSNSAMSNVCQVGSWSAPITGA